MNRITQFRAAYRRTTVWFAALMLACLALGAGLALAQTGAAKNYDHLKTGFALTGTHVQTRCESCHQNGIFKGTPRDCASCHVSGMRFARGNVVRPPSHLPTTQGCDSCHNTKSYVGASFNHQGVVAGSCQSCHNGSTSSGKSANHIQTNASCDSCHRTTAWLPAAGFDHAGVAAGTCTSCHGAGRATGRPANHVPIGSVAAAATASCDACHKGSFSTWANGRFHANFAVASGCASCHTGGFISAVGKPNTAVHSGVTNCETCHNTAGWAGAKVDHSTFNVSTNCASCHNGSAATAKPASHVPTGSTVCFSCHNVSPAGWKPTKWNHTQTVVAAQCDSCHSGGFPPADGKPTNHVPYASVAAAAAAKCDTCHKGSFTSWANGRFHSNISVSSGCVACHTLSAGGNYLNAVGKPATATHASVTGNCESCHKSTTSWASASVDHSTFSAATNCAQCHGVTASGKSATHIPTTLNCFSCHNVSPQGWTPTKWNHTQVVVANACASCHTGGYPPADGRPTNHIPYQTVAVSSAANCDACHKGSTTTWANGKFHSFYSVSTGCVTCHTLTAGGSYLNAVGKPSTATHAAVTGNCESCHKTTTTWAGAKTDHSTFTAATVCSTCHNGSTATGKPATHFPTTANCFACHNVSPASWTPTKWNHTQLVVANACASCHSGGFPPADGRPTNHIPYQTVAITAAANCDGCHKGTTTTWANGRLHSSYSISSGCVSCHTLTPGGSYLSAVGKPTTATHTGVTGSCESCHKSTVSWSSVTFAHSPANAVGTGTCDTCHNGSTALGKPASHIPITSATARCDSCHKSQASFATSTTMNHTVVTTQQCKLCHNGSYVSQGTQGALAKPSNHIPEVQLLNGALMDCNACHTNAAAWTTMTMNHNGSLGNGAGWCKACHQSGTSYLGSMQKKSLTHQKTTGVTDCSQSGCHRPLGNKGTAYRNWD